MVELLNFTRDQLVEEVQKKEASRVKLKEKLVQLKELSVNTAQVLQLNRKLEEQLASANKKQQASTKDCQALRADLKTAHDLTEEANTLLTEQERNQNSLQQQLTAAKVRATKAEQSSSQAQTAKSKSEMAHKALQSELADLRKQLAHFQAGLKSVEQRQKADHQDVAQLKSQVTAPAPAQTLSQACQGCSAVQQVVLGLQKQMQEKDLASAKGSTKANSFPSTQDHSGDTLDDRSQLHLRSEMRGLQEQLVTCQDQQEQFEAEMQRWRTLFGTFAALAAPGATALQASSDLMQISPAGAEGSNVVPRNTPDEQTRREGARVQHRVSVPHTVALPVAAASAQAGNAGSTAGELRPLKQGCPDVLLLPGQATQAGQSPKGTEPGDIPAARVNSTGGDSDTFSAAPGTTRHLMLPTHQQHASPNAQPRPQPQPAALLVPDPPAQAASPKRKTIALQPGALQIPDGGRKRRKLAKAVQADQGQTAQVPCHVTQRGRQQTLPLGHSPALPHLAKYGAPVTDATAVDFMEVQLARICNTQTPITAGLVSAVAHDICSAWQTRQCPLECIHTGFIAVLLDCAAAPPLKAAKPPESAKANPAAANHSHTTSPWTGATPGTPTCQAFGDSAFARLWCSETACQQHHFTWLIHCAVELDHLLSSPARPSPDQTHDRAGSKPSADSSMPSQISKGPGTAVKKRGRPPGSRNKKTLLRLQEEGLSPHSLPPAKAKQVPAAGLQHSSQQQPDQQANQQQSRATCLTPLPEGALLKALHRQALHYLGQACQVKSPGPFETEVCCLSAAAASFARLQGKVQALRVQVLNTVCSKGLPERTKLQSIAAAVELWPEALLPAMSSQASAPTTLETCLDSLLQHLGILGVCLHANLEHLCKQHGALECSTVNDEQLGQQSAADVPATTADRSGKAGRQLLLKWGQCPVTQTAGQVLHSLLGTSWQQGASQAGQQLDSAAQQFNGSAVSLSDMAAEQVLAELKELGTAENGEAGPVDDRWVDLGLALQLMISVLGWEWAYEQVLNKLMGPIVSALLAPASGDSGHWAVHNLQQLLRCMLVTVQALMDAGRQNRNGCTAAVGALLQRLSGMAHKYASHAVVSELLSNAVLSMRNHVGQESLTQENGPVPESKEVEIETF